MYLDRIHPSYLSCYLHPLHSYLPAHPTFIF